MDILSDVNVSGNLKVNNTLQVCGTVAFGYLSSCGSGYGIKISGDNNEKRSLYVSDVNSTNAYVSDRLYACKIQTHGIEGISQLTDVDYLQTNCLKTNLLVSNDTHLAFETPDNPCIGPLVYFYNRSVTVPQNCSKFFILQSFCTGGNNHSGQKLYPFIQSVSSDKTNFVDYEFSFDGSSNEKISVIGSITPNADGCTVFDFQLLFPTISPV